MLNLLVIRLGMEGDDDDDDKDQGGGAANCHVADQFIRKLQREETGKRR